MKSSSLIIQLSIILAVFLMEGMHAKRRSGKKSASKKPRFASDPVAQSDLNLLISERDEEHSLLASQKGTGGDAAPVVKSNKDSSDSSSNKNQSSSAPSSPSSSDANSSKSKPQQPPSGRRNSNEGEKSKKNKDRDEDDDEDEKDKDGKSKSTIIVPAFNNGSNGQNNPNGGGSGAPYMGPSYPTRLAKPRMFRSGASKCTASTFALLLLPMTAFAFLAVI